MFVEVTAADSKTGIALNERLEWYLRNGDDQRFLRHFDSLHEAEEFCRAMALAHPAAEFWIQTGSEKYLFGSSQNLPTPRTLDQIQKLEDAGYVVLLKWDGERQRNTKTVVLISPDGESKRLDGDNLNVLFSRLLNDLDAY